MARRGCEGTRRASGWVGTVKCRPNDSSQAVTSLRNDVLDRRHVAPGGLGGFLGCASLLARAHVRRVPVPPVMLGRDLLKVAVMLGRLVQQVRQRRNVHDFVLLPRLTGREAVS